MNPMTIDRLVEALEAMAGIAFLVWFFYGPWSRFIVDLVRQNLFEIRDEIFMAAARGRLTFDCEVYCSLRDTLNAMIRFCESFSFASFAMTPSVAARGEISVFHLLKDLQDRELAAWLERRIIHASMLLALAAVFRSFVGLSVTILAFPVMVARLLLNGTRQQTGLLYGLIRRVERDVSMGDGVRV